jgi:hypothetical protein
MKKDGNFASSDDRPPAPPAAEARPAHVLAYADTCPDLPHELESPPLCISVSMPLDWCRICDVDAACAAGGYELPGAAV